MSLWSLRHQLGYALLGIGFLALLVGVPITLTLLGRSPTCFDRTRNQGESGVDCGGPCTLLCGMEAAAPLVLWARATRVTETVYNAAALIENRNAGAGARNVPYSFKLYDSRNVLILEERGTISLPPQTRIPIFAGGLVVGARPPARTFFAFTDEPIWEKMEHRAAALTVQNVSLSHEMTAPRVTAELVNTGVETIRDITVVALLYSPEGSIVATSRTVVDQLGKNRVATITFTWPEPLPARVGKVDLFPSVPLE
ncbi:MAG: hypothetical protein Q8R39_00575 [bacterium]|nr:hypothetical protein [bacterium]MDZ4284531.1 hypothetical protein [Patescibacteria group bacterium]